MLIEKRKSHIFSFCIIEYRAGKMRWQRISLIPRAGLKKEGGISMREDSRETARNMISMEEYLRKRQAIRRRERGQRTEGGRETVAALKLTELLYV